MTPEQFRQHGHEVVDWIADYWSRIESFPVRSQVSPGEIRAALPATAPERGEPLSAVLADLDRIVLPGTTQCTCPPNPRSRGAIQAPTDTSGSCCRPSKLTGSSSPGQQAVSGRRGGRAGAAHTVGR